MTLEPFMKKALKICLSEGSSEVEVFGSRSRTLSLYIDDQKIKNIEEKMDQGIAVRVIKGKKVGQSSTTIASIRDAERCGQTACRLADASAPEPVMKNFTKGSRGAPVPNAYDKALASMTQEQLAQMAKELVSAASGPGEVKVPNGVIRVAVQQYMVLNTNGAETDQRSTLLYAHAGAMTLGDDPGEGNNFAFTPHLQFFDPTDFGQVLAKRAVAAQRAEHFHGKENLTVILPPHELAELIEGSAGYAMSAENVNRQRSPWAKKLGEKVASNKLTMIDDPTAEKGMSSCAYDDEGTPTKPRVLVDRGTLKGFMYDHYNAVLAGTSSTGNALRRSFNDAQNTYRDPLMISPINLVVEPGGKSLEDVVSGVDRGIMVDKLASAEANPVTGAFGLEVRSAYLIEKGEVKGTIDHALLAGNMFAALSQIREVANDSTTIRNCILPSVAFDGLELIGQ
ncbi:MAG: protease TldD [Methanomassiliicoccales archaeon PtaU1.Bin124]|nr:MAG: protease TldD [Methanomassiliicoccales archaeon PtaU1.Bin124]